MDDVKFKEDIYTKVNQFAIENKIGNETIFLPNMSQIRDECGSEAGYLEEDDDEDLVDFNQRMIKIEHDVDDEDSFDNKTKKVMEHVSDPNTLKKILPMKNTPKNITVVVEQKEFNDQTVDVIKPEMMLEILHYFYEELNSGFIELSDNFSDQRRLQFSKNEHNTYISIIELYLQKKDDLFLCVLSDIMTKLNINQNLLNNTNSYFMQYADQEDLLVQNVKNAFDKIYQAGRKE